MPTIAMLLATDPLSCAASCICKGCRAVTAQTLPLSLSFLVILILSQCVGSMWSKRLLPSHMELDEVNSLMSLTEAKVGNVCVFEH